MDDGLKQRRPRAKHCASVGGVVAVESNSKSLTSGCRVPARFAGPLTVGPKAANAPKAISARRRLSGATGALIDGPSSSKCCRATPWQQQPANESSLSGGCQTTWRAVGSVQGDFDDLARFVHRIGLG